MSEPRWRADFPLLAKRDDVVYLDNAATTQKPAVVLDALRRYYETTNANVHRGAHRLSDEATEAFETARETLARRINAQSPKEVIWTRGTTEAINLVAAVYAPLVLGEDDQVLITEMEHHSNIVPWQNACRRTGAVLKAVRVLPSGELDLDDFDAKLDERTRIVALSHVSNALGTVNDLETLITKAKGSGAAVVVDGAQAVAHFDVDVRELGCDFYAFSGHKMYGPTGIGVLYGREELLDNMPPWQSGGEMIERVRIEATTYAPLPFKFEAGTPDISGVVALASAADYLDGLDTVPPCRRTSPNCSPAPLRRSSRWKGCASWAPQPKRDPYCRSYSTGHIHTTSEPYSMPRASPCGPATTARCR